MANTKPPISVEQWPKNKKKRNETKKKRNEFRLTQLSLAAVKSEPVYLRERKKKQEKNLKKKEKEKRTALLHSSPKLGKTR